MNEETEFHILAQDHFDCFDQYSEKAVPMRQPIHTTIKPKTQVERFELAWRVIELFLSTKCQKNFSNGIQVDLGKSYAGHQVNADYVATALEIILQCRTFSPGVFERKENGVWQRAGETQKHDNAEGC